MIANRIRMNEWQALCLCGGLGMLVVLGTGCQREPIPEPPAHTPAPGAAPAAQPVKVDAVPTADAAQPAEPAVPPAAPATHTVRVLGEEEALIAVRAITDVRGRGLRVGVVSKANGSSALLSAGNVFADHTLIGFDAERDVVVFLWKQEHVGIALSAASPAYAATPAAVPDSTPGELPSDPMGPPPERIDLSDIDQDNFEPTEDEKAKGIDPNNAETWPEGYRGPVIERLIEKQRAAGIEPEMAPPGIFPTTEP